VTVESVNGGSTTPPPPTTTNTTVPGCDSAYSSCLSDLPGEASNCGDLSAAQKPVTVLVPGVDPYNLDGIGCQ
jgi:hypothetical protein